MYKALIVVDMQKDFIDGALGTNEAQAIIGQAQRRIEMAKGEGRALLFTLDTHDEAYMETSEGRHLPVAHCVKGMAGWGLHEALAPYAEKTFEKPSFGAPELVAFLAPHAGKAGELLDIAMLGLCTDICVITNALMIRAHFPEAKITVFADSCAGVTPEKHAAALSVLASCHVEIA